MDSHDVAVLAGTVSTVMFVVSYLPMGPIWFLHGFYLLATALMLVWHRRFVPGVSSADPDADVIVGRGRRPLRCRP